MEYKIRYLEKCLSVFSVHTIKKYIYFGLNYPFKKPGMDPGISTAGDQHPNTTFAGLFDRVSENNSGEENTGIKGKEVFPQQ